MIFDPCTSSLTKNLFALIFDTIYDSYQQNDIAKERNEIDHTFERKRARLAWRERRNIIIEKSREILRNYEISKILVKIFVLVDNKTYIEFGKVRYRNYLVLLDDIWLSFASSNIIRLDQIIFDIWLYLIQYLLNIDLVRQCAKFQFGHLCGLFFTDRSVFYPKCSLSA